jgi:hypothetical protein
MCLLSFCVSLSFLSPVAAQSTGATFAFSPSTKAVRPDTTFTVNIVIKANTEKKISYARAIVVFDPTELEITNAESGSIFCNYPTDQANYESDNTAGQLMITGISTGVSGCEYPLPTSTGIVFATITFKAKKLGNAEVSFVYNGRQADDQSGITDTNSPPQFFMTTPQDATFSVTSGPTPTPTPKVPPDLGVDPRITIAVTSILVLFAWRSVRKPRAQRVIATTEV